MPELPPFKLERYFGEYEFKVQYLLSASDCESLSLADLLALADADSLRRWDELRLGYTESQGDPALRAAISARYQNVRPDDVLIAVPEEAIYILMHTLLEPGDHAVSIHPAYQSLYAVARARGRSVTDWPLELAPDGRGWQLDLEQLAAAITPRTRLLVVNFPHNPTGFLPARSELEAIIALARQHDLYLFSDEMYRGLELDPARRLPAVCDLYEKGISLSGLSKTLSAPGLRLGWLASRAPGLIDRWLAYKEYTTICHSAPSEVLGLIAVRAADVLLERNRQIVQRNLGLADQFFARHAARFTWLPPQAGSIAFPAWRGPGSVDAFCQAVLDEQGVMIVPGSMFDAPGPHFRVGLGRANFGEALSRLEHYLQRH